MHILDLFRKKKSAGQTPSDLSDTGSTNTASAAKAGPQRVNIDGHWYMVCEECGTPVDNYSKILNPACNLLGKCLCPACFKKLRKTTTVVCKECGQTFPYLEMKSRLCPVCWNKHIAKLRDFHGEYHARLSHALNEMEISVSPAGTEHADASGRATFPIVPSFTDCSPLRKDVRGYGEGDERAVFTVKARGAVFALPDNGIGIRYIKADADKSFMDHANSLAAGRSILAIASDGKDLFVLDDTGSVLSTKQDWEVCPLFDIAEEVRRITRRYFDESELSAAVRQYERGMPYITSSVTGGITYDCKQNAFIQYLDCGNSHEGIERVYSEISRQDVLQQLTRYHFDLRKTVFSAQEGTIPLISIVERLTVHDKDAEVHVPESRWVY